MSNSIQSLINRHGRVELIQMLDELLIATVASNEWAAKLPHLRANDLRMLQELKQVIIFAALAEDLRTIESE